MLSLLAAGTALAEDAQQYDGVGRAPISGGDRVRARQRALDEAFQHAVEGAVGALLGTDVLARRAADLRLKILPRARSYVRSHRVVEEGELEPGIFVVHVTAEVAAERLVRELAEPQKQARAPVDSPRQVLCVSGGVAPRVEAGLHELLAGRGYEVVIASRCDDDELARVVRGSAARGSLTATIVAAPPSGIRGTALVGREVKLALQLADAGGHRTADSHADGAGYGKDAAEALDDAATSALVEAATPIAAALGGAVVTGAKSIVTARIIGVRRFAQLTTVRAALERLPAVDGAEPRRFVPGPPSTIELGVRTALAPHAVAEALARVAATYQLRVRESDGVVLIEVLDAPDAKGSN